MKSARKSSLNTSGLVVGAGFLLVVFLHFNSLIDPVNVPHMCLFGLLGLGLGVRALLRPVLVKIPGIWLLAGGGWLLMSLLSLTQAINLPEAFYSLSRTAIYLGLLLTLIQSGSGKTNWLRSVSSGISILIIVESLLGLAQAGGLELFNLSVFAVPAGTLVNKNIFARMLLLGIPFAGVLLLRGSRWEKILGGLALLLALSNIFLAGSRGVWLGLTGMLMFGVPLLIGECAKKRPTWMNVKLVLVLYGAGLFLGAGIFFHRMPGEDLANRWGRFQEKIEERNFGEGSSMERLVQWHYTLKMANENPILGVGAGNWHTHITRHGVVGNVQQFGTRLFKRPHNDFLGVSSEIGWLGGLAYLLFLFLPIGRAIRLARRAGDRDERLEAILLGGGLTAFAVVSFFAFPMERMLTFSLMLVQMAVIMSRSISSEEKRSWNLSGRPMAGLAMVMILPGLFFAQGRLRAEPEARKVSRARDRLAWEQVIRHADRVDQNFMNHEGVAGTPISWYRGVANYSLGRIREAEQDFLKAQELHPWHPHVLQNLAATYDALGRREEAIQLFKQVLERFPAFEEVRLNLAAIYFSEKRHQEAIEVLCSFDFQFKRGEKTRYLKVIRQGMGDSEEPPLCP